MMKRIGLVGLLLSQFLLAAPTSSHYQISIFRDMPLTFFAGFSAVFGNYRLTQMNVPEEGPLHENNLLPWDRPMAGRYNENADRASNWAAALGVAPLALGAYSWYEGDASGYDFAAYTLMFVQALAIQSGVNLMVRSLEFWPRPYVYARDCESCSPEARKKAENARGEAYGSFFSGHASAAFTVAYFTGEWFSEMYPNSPYKNLVWAGSLSAAGLVGVLRIAAGKHYLTDVAVGALAGAGISYAVIEIHKNRQSRVSLWGGYNAVGVSLRM